MNPEKNSGPPQDQHLLGEVIASYLKAVDAGETPSREDLLGRHPQIASQLQEFFEDQQDLGRLVRKVSPAEPMASPLDGRRTFGHYELLEEIARGGMGVVYKARELNLDRVVALKAILSGRLASRAEVERFRREARAVANLDHPRIVPIYEVGEEGGIHYFTMKFLEGGSLARLASRLRSNPRRAAEIVESIARAVQHAHERGILHRDLKPANILLDTVGEPHVSDFGLAKPLQGDSSLTEPGQLVGTASYMAPERADGRRRELTPAADIYSLGTIFYELLTGRPPFQGDSSLETLRQVIEENPRRPRSLNRQVPADLETICLKCLEKEPRKRYPTAAALAEDLRRFLAGEPILARPASWLERGVSWCRRHPAHALAAGLTVSIAMVSTVAAVWLGVERNRALENLWLARLAQARALALSGRPGQRVDGLKAVAEAAAIRRGLDLRNAAIACLSLTDIEIEKQWTGFPPGTRALAFDARLERYAMGDLQGNVEVMEAGGDRKLASFPGDGHPAVFLLFSRDGNLLARRSHEIHEVGEATVWSWRQDSSPVVRSCSEVKSVTVDLSPDGRLLAFGAPDRTTRVIEIATGKEESRFTAGDVTNSVYFDGQGKKLAVYLQYRDVQVHELASGRKVFDQSGSGGAIAWHPSGEILAIGAFVDFSLWSLSTGERLRTISGHDNPVHRLSFSPQGDLLAGSSWDGTLHLWNLAGQELVRFFGYAPVMHFSSDGQRLGYFQTGGAVGLWKVDPARDFRVLPQAAKVSFPLSFHPQGRVLAIPHLEGIRFWDLLEEKEIFFLPIPELGQVHFHPSSRALLTCGSPGLLRWPLAMESAPEGDLLHVGPPEAISRTLGKGLYGSCLSPDGGWLAVRDRHSHLVLVDLEKPQEAVKEFTHLNLWEMDISPGGRWLATGPQHGKDIKVWDSATGEQMTSIPSRSYVVSARVGFSPDGQWLLTSTGEEYSLWQVGSWRLQHRLRRRDLGELGGPFAFTRDGRLLAVAISRRAIQLIDLRAGKELATLEPPRSKVLERLTFSPEGDRLLCTAGPFSKEIQIWDLSRLRADLGNLGLDWDPPSSPAPASQAPSRPLRLEFDLGELAGARSKER